MKNNNNADQTAADAVVEKTSISSATTHPQGWSESSSDWIAPPSNPNAYQSPRTAALVAQDISVSYGTHQVLDDVSFTLYQGDTLGLLGLNGAGKSTLLNVLSGATAPQHGKVQIGNHELFDDIIEPRMNIGYAPDKPAVYPEFKVKEFLYFIARVRRLEKRSIKNSVNNIIERCALGDVRNRIIGNLSTGYQQRVNIAQAMIHAPKILILDEPSNGLDPVQLLEIRELVSTLAPEQATIFSSHLLTEVNSICNRVMLINDGRQILDAPLESLTDKRHNAYEIQLSREAQRPNENQEQLPANFTLQDLPGVTHACMITAGRWLVTGDSLTQDHLKVMLESRGQQATQITLVENYLESLFRQLASTENTGTTPKATGNTGNAL